MEIAILETGRPPGALAERFGGYPSMFARLLGDGFETETFDIAAGQFPEPGNNHACYLITGSPAGVYDDLPWIEGLCEFVRAAASNPIVGVCFGHQLMAQALGGRVEKSKKGWGTGLHRYRIVRHEPWMGTNPPDQIAAPASHQDQVIEQPPETDVFATSDFTPFAGLSWRDRPAITFQFHPEFSPDYAKALVAERRGDLPNPDMAIESLDAPNDSERIAQWIRRFFRESER